MYNLKIKKTISDKYNIVDNTQKRVNMGMDDFKYYFKMFENFEMSGSVISKKMNIDRRTLSSYWLKMGYVSKKRLNELNKISKVKAIKDIALSKKIPVDILNEIKYYLETECRYDKITPSSLHDDENSIKNDKFKDKLALENGFEIVRFDEKEVKNIDILTNIKNILNGI